MLTRRALIKMTRNMAAGSLLTMSWWNIISSRLYAVDNKYDLIAVKGGNSPVDLFNAAIRQMGGMQKFIKKGGSVLIKPNIGWDRPPEYGANTNPDLIAAVVKGCYSAGAAKVYMFDHTCDEWQGCYKKSGIQKAASASGAELVPASSDQYFVKTSFPAEGHLKRRMCINSFLTATA